MEKLFIEHQSKNQIVHQLNSQTDDVLVEIHELELITDNDIGNGNLLDYLEIYGELDDN